MELFEPLPARILVVLQIPMFESWWLSDPEGLVTSPHVEIDLSDCAWSNVDAEVNHPGAWLKARQVSGGNMKSPTVARDVVSGLEIERMVERSPSFEKFYREVRIGFDTWCDEFLKTVH